MMLIRATIVSQLKLLCGVVTVVLVSVFALPTQALDTQVLSNFNQRSSGDYYRLYVRDLMAIPFTTDNTFLEFDAAELPVQTWYGTGGLQLSIWSVNNAHQPDTQIAALSGPSNPTGFARYTGSVTLSANTSYFLVLSVANGGSPIIVPAIDDSGADSTPSPIWEFGIDTTGNGAADRINRCSGSRANDYVTITWSCDYPRALVYYPKVRFLAEEATPPGTYSLSSSPNPLIFGSTPVGTTSAALTATITNDGSAAQTLGALSLATGSRYSIGTDNCSGQSLTASATCTVDLSFTPDHGGRIGGTLIIPADASDTRSPYSLPLVGTGEGVTVARSVASAAVITEPKPSEPVPLPLWSILMSILWILVYYRWRT